MRCTSVPCWPMSYHCSRCGCIWGNGTHQIHGQDPGRGFSGKCKWRIHIIMMYTLLKCQLQVLVWTSVSECDTPLVSGQHFVLFPGRKYCHCSTPFSKTSTLHSVLPFHSWQTSGFSVKLLIPRTICTNSSSQIINRFEPSNNQP